MYIIIYNILYNNINIILTVIFVLCGRLFDIIGIDGSDVLSIDTIHAVRVHTPIITSQG